MSREAKSPASSRFGDNQLESRDLWLRAATDALRPLFESHGYPLPERIRFAIAFPSSGRKGQQVGETWHSPASADGTYEIILRADLFEPAEVLAVLVRQLVHAALPATESHGKRYRAAAMKIGLEGRMRTAVPGPYLEERLNALAAELPPLPHARLDIDWKALDKPKKQGTRMLKAECPGVIGGSGKHEPCGYTVRLSAKWASLGAWCPRHGEMQIEPPEEYESEHGHNDSVYRDRSPVEALREVLASGNE
jgi:hypothetical protein